MAVFHQCGTGSTQLLGFPLGKSTLYFVTSCRGSKKVEVLSDDMRELGVQYMVTVVGANYNINNLHNILRTLPSEHQFNNAA